jgi:hypothetical protein
MKKTLAYLSIALIAIGCSVAASAATRAAKDVKVKGEIIDNACFESKNGVHGAAHKSCAMSCAKGGSQLAVLEEGTNTVYLISGDYSANKNEKLIPFVAEIVEVQGTVTEKDGKKWLAVKSIKKPDMK